MTDNENLKSKLAGCYVTIPTMFHDEDLSLDLDAIKSHIQYLIEKGMNAENAVFLAGGAAGDFSSMKFDERITVAKAIIEEANGRIPVAIGAQTTNTLELVNLVKTAADLGADFVQISPPYYFNHTEGDFYEFAKAGAEACKDIGIIIYNTFWTSTNVSHSLVEKLAEIPNIVGLKWAVPRTDAMEFETVCAKYSKRFCIIDNNLLFNISFMMGARAIEVHICNYWPEQGIMMYENLKNKNYEAVQNDLIEKIMPFYHLWVQIEQEYTSGDGYLDKLCMEMIGLPSSRCRPPTRDIRQKYREQTRNMMLHSGVPGVLA